MENKRYYVCNTWGCSLDGPYERCSIGYATEEDEENDGMGYVGRGGGEGLEFFIVDSLEEALVSSNFNPYFIRLYELDEEDLTLKDKILQKYKWDSYKGLVKKNKQDIDQLPGQTDLFDIIDKENNND